MAPGPAASFHHVAMTVHDIAGAFGELRRFGYDQLGETVVDERQGVAIAFAESTVDPTLPRLELVAVHGEGSVVARLLAKNGAGLYHCCYAVTGLEQRVAALEAEGYAVLGPPVAAPALDGRCICFLFHRQLGLVELVEQEPGRG